MCVLCCELFFSFLVPFHHLSSSLVTTSPGPRRKCRRARVCARARECGEASRAYVFFACQDFFLSALFLCLLLPPPPNHIPAFFFLITRAQCTTRPDAGPSMRPSRTACTRSRKNRRRATCRRSFRPLSPRPWRLHGAFRTTVWSSRFRIANSVGMHARVTQSVRCVSTLDMVFLFFSLKMNFCRCAFPFFLFLSRSLTHSLQTCFRHGAAIPL